MVNPTYKHLEDRIRIGAFSIGQWLQILVCAGLALCFGVYVSPFPPSATVFIAIVLAGLPVALSYGAMGLDFSVGELGSAAARYYTRPRRYVPGAGTRRPGYVVQKAPPAPGDSDDGEAVDDFLQTTDGLWDY